LRERQVEARVGFAELFFDLVFKPIKSDLKN